MKTKLIVTLGPATATRTHLLQMKERGVDFVRVNLSHSSLKDLERFIALAKDVGIPFVLDTEGSQIRTGEMRGGSARIEEGAEVAIYRDALLGTSRRIMLKPAIAVEQLIAGDLIYIDFHSLVLRVSDTGMLQKKGYVKAVAVTSGTLGSNKAVIVDSALPSSFRLPALTEKDRKAIAIGLREGVGVIAASFMRSRAFVEEVRAATKGTMQIISKIECRDALAALDDITAASDFLLIDRGDLSKEVDIEKIPLLQKTIMSAAGRHGKGVFVATNLLESMTEKKQPTRAEVHDVVTTVLDGAYGLALSAETAIGKHPIACINMMNRLMKQAELVHEERRYRKVNDRIARDLSKMGYLLSDDRSSSLATPHGGRLVDRVLRAQPDKAYLASLPTLMLDAERQMDAEQIAFGVFSPIEGFMGKKDFESVLDSMRLRSGDVWTIPIILDASKEAASGLRKGTPIALCDEKGPMAILHLEEKYSFDKEETSRKLYGTTDASHPGVRWVNSLQPVLLGGKIDLIRRRTSGGGEHELTPRQARHLFEERGWERVVGFHTRNVIHKSHEFIQLDALRRANADGLFVHPVIGKKKAGDFHAKYIIAAYEKMMRHFYPRDSAVFATYATWSRYAGPREAVFTALCRKNFGCSHFIVGRDHTGVGTFYAPKASHEIFGTLPNLGITPVFFDHVFYSHKHGRHIHEPEGGKHREKDKAHISGGEARRMLEARERPPEWYMRPEISDIILSALDRKEEVFVPEAKKKGAVVWLTGLSGSGKTTVAEELQRRLLGLGKTVEILDGDAVRKGRHRHLGFSREDIRENNRLLAELAAASAKRYDVVIVSVIAPFRADRAASRRIVGENFYEVFLDCPLKKCVERDTKGLYKKALSGELTNVIGVSKTHPYEVPDTPDLVLHTDRETQKESTDRLLTFLRIKG